MTFLRRLLGGTTDADQPPTQSVPPADADDAEARERAYELDVLRDEQARLDDLAQRQLRYADHAWQPPAEGGARRADDQGSGEPP